MTVPRETMPVIPETADKATMGGGPGGAVGGALTAVIAVLLGEFTDMDAGAVATLAGAIGVLIGYGTGFVFTYYAPRNHPKPV